MKELKDEFLEKYPRCTAIPKYWERANDCDFTWENLSKARLQAFVDYMGKMIAPGSVRQYCAKLKAVLNRFNEEVALPKDFAKTLSPRADKAAATFLTEADIDKIVAYVPDTDIEQMVRDSFLIGCFTGARHSDFVDFDESNIVGDHLMYVSKKTRVQSVVPIKPIVRELLQTKWRPISDVTYNATLRSICRKCGLDGRTKIYRAGKLMVGEKYEFITSHTARRSFATNLYLRGLDIYTISRFLGHKSVEMTAQNYICAPIRELPESVESFFA